MSPRPKNIRKVNDMPVTAGFKPIGLNSCCKNTIFLHLKSMRRYGYAIMK